MNEEPVYIDFKSDLTLRDDENFTHDYRTHGKGHNASELHHRTDGGRNNGTGVGGGAADVLIVGLHGETDAGGGLVKEDAYILTALVVLLVVVLLMPVKQNRLLGCLRRRCRRHNRISPLSTAADAEELDVDVESTIVGQLAAAAGKKLDKPPAAAAAGDDGRRRRSKAEPVAISDRRRRCDGGGGLILATFADSDSCSKMADVDVA